MKTFLSSGIAIVVAITVFYQCQTAKQITFTPKVVTDFVQTMGHDAKPIKTVLDQKNGYVYWLSFVGGLHSIQLDGKQHCQINQGDETWKDVTFIEDFSLNQGRDKIYFTDLLDLKTGQSAIKVTDIEGKHIEVISYLTDEIPYHISLSSDNEKLFYLSKSVTKNRVYYQLKFIDLQKNIKGTLYASVHRIDSLNYDPVTQTVNVQYTMQKQLSFSTDLRSMQGLAEAFK